MQTQSLSRTLIGAAVAMGAATVLGACAPASPGTGSPAPAPAGRLRIISTNDFHGTFEPRADALGVRRGGAAHVATAIGRARAECVAPACHTLLLDGGDMFQGTPASNLAFGRPVVELFDALDYAAAALGNHEFDWGQDTLRARMREAPFRILGANARYEDGRDVEWIPNDTIVARGPWRIGIVGIATVETKRVTAAANTVGLRFDPPAPIVDSIARALRARGAHAVVVVAHAGAQCEGRATCQGEIVEVARAIREPVNAIVSGHSHSAIDTVVNGIPIVQARSNGRAVAVLDVPVGGSAVAPAGEVREVLTDSIAPDDMIAALIDRAIAPVRAIIARPIAEIRDAMPRQGEQHALGNLIADAQRWAGQGDVSIMNNGGIRADLRAGNAAYGALYEIQPFANRLMRVTLRGDALRDYFERIVRGNGLPRVHVSGIRIEYDTTRAPGARITRLALANGTVVDDARTYTLVLSDFLFTGGDGLGPGEAVLRAEQLGIVDLDALIRYLQQLPKPIAAPRDARFVPGGTR